MYKHFALLAFLCTISFSTFATTVLPQAISTGEDGVFNIGTDSLLLTDSDNIYNFTDFIIADNLNLDISSGSAIFIYSSQSITINGSITADTLDLNFIAPQITINGSINTSSNISFYIPNDPAGTTEFPHYLESALITSDNLDATITIGIAYDASLDSNNSVNTLSQTSLINSSLVIINPTPVPLPAALWLMISGLAGFGLIGFRRAV